MSKTDRATPRPWMAAGTVKIGPGTCRPRIYGPTERIAGDVVDPLICVCDSQGLYHSAATSEEMDAEARANAALIVRAVNSYDKLVVACEAALRTIREDAPALMEPRWGPDSGEHGTVRKLRAALALARGN